MEPDTDPTAEPQVEPADPTEADPPWRIEPAVRIWHACGWVTFDTQSAAQGALDRHVAGCQL